MRYVCYVRTRKQFRTILQIHGEMFIDTLDGRRRLSMIAYAGSFQEEKALHTHSRLEAEDAVLQQERTMKQIPNHHRREEPSSITKRGSVKCVYIARAIKPTDRFYSSNFCVDGDYDGRESRSYQSHERFFDSKIEFPTRICAPTCVLLVSRLIRGGSCNAC